MKEEKPNIMIEILTAIIVIVVGIFLGVAGSGRCDR